MLRILGFSLEDSSATHRAFFQAFLKEPQCSKVAQRRTVISDAFFSLWERLHVAEGSCVWQHNNLDTKRGCRDKVRGGAQKESQTGRSPRVVPITLGNQARGLGRTRAVLGRTIETQTVTDRTKQLKGRFQTDLQKAAPVMECDFNQSPTNSLIQIWLHVSNVDGKEYCFLL
eukprot:2977125-Amphidinium_carterae.1